MFRSTPDFFPRRTAFSSSSTWRAHASSPCQSSCLCPGLWGWEGATGQGVTGSGVRRMGLPISVCTHSVHRGWWPAFERSPSRPEPSPSPDRTERRGAPSESQTSATAGGKTHKIMLSTHCVRWTLGGRDMFTAQLSKHQLLIEIFRADLCAVDPKAVL